MVEGKPISDSRKGCPYKVYVNKFMQNSGAEIICSYTIVLICNIATAVYCRHLRLQKKGKLCPQKGKQASLKSKSFCAMLRKKRLKCGRIPARLFLACHQKSNTFKCKQFCCAKPMCAYLSVGCPLYPRQRRAAAPSSRLSVGSSAHSHANAPELERVHARASCFASRSLALLS